MGLLLTASLKYKHVINNWLVLWSFLRLAWLAFVNYVGHYFVGSFVMSSVSSFCASLTSLPSPTSPPQCPSTLVQLWWMHYMYAELIVHMYLYITYIHIQLEIVLLFFCVLFFHELFSTNSYHNPFPAPRMHMQFQLPDRTLLELILCRLGGVPGWKGGNSLII